MVELITLEEVEKQENSKENKKKKGERKQENKVEVVISALEAMGYAFAYNELSKEIEMLDKDGGKPVIMDDYTFNIILVELWRNYYSISEGTLKTIIIGAMAEKYHPIRTYFDSLPKWDGVDHIAKLANTIEIEDLGLQLKAKWPEYLKKWLVAAAAQATIDDATNHMCLVLMGPQGKGKTTFLNALCPPDLSHLLYTGHLNVTEKDTYNLLAEKFIINIDDQLDIMGDLRKLKSMFTLDKIANRKAYAKFSPNRPRISSFVASVNSNEFLTDDANRRYLVFSIIDIDLPGIKKTNHAQLWAQIKYYLNAGFKFWFDKEENEVITDINDSFRVRTEEEEMLALHFEPDDNYGIPMQQTEILSFLSARTSSKLNSRRLSTALKKRGFLRKNSRIEGKSNPIYVYMMRELNDLDKSKTKEKIKKELTENKY